MNLTAAELVRNRAKEKWEHDELVLSMTVKLVRTAEIVEIAATAGFDSLYIDLEHSSFSIDTTSQLCMAGLKAGVAPFVRVPNISPEYITRILDGGALGIIAPHIESPRQAAAIVAAARYAPRGTRSFTGSLPHLGFRSFPFAEMAEAMNAATAIIVMIESAEALDQVDAIAAVEGVDLLFVGTNDLCSALGVPGQLDHPSVQAAYGKCLDACRNHGKRLGVGGLAGRPDLVADLVQRGARYVSTGTDLSFLLGGATAKARQMRGC